MTSDGAVPKTTLTDASVTFGVPGEPAVILPGVPPGTLTVNITAQGPEPPVPALGD